jgi:hypothetical protein
MEKNTMILIAILFGIVLGQHLKVTASSELTDFIADLYSTIGRLTNRALNRFDWPILFQPLENNIGEQVADALFPTIEKAKKPQRKHATD